MCSDVPVSMFQSMYVVPACMYVCTLEVIAITADRQH